MAISPLILLLAGVAIAAGLVLGYVAARVAIAEAALVYAALRKQK